MATPSIEQLIARVQNLEDLTIQKIYELSHIDLESFTRWAKQLQNVGHVVEYDGQSSRIVIRGVANGSHQMARIAFVYLFRKIARELGDELCGHPLLATAFRRFPLHGKHAGSSRLPDMCITSRPAQLPLAVFQVGNEADHDALFADAERWLTGTLGVTELVILMTTELKLWPSLALIFKTQAFLSSWNLSEKQIRVQYNNVDLLAAHIIDYYDRNGRTLSGEYFAKVYFCTKDDVHPARPVHAITYSALRAQIAMADSRFAPNNIAFATKDDTSFSLCGHRFEFPQAIAWSLTYATEVEEKQMALRLAKAKLSQLGVVPDPDALTTPMEPEDEGFFYDAWQAMMDDRQGHGAKGPRQQ